jgi:hypothetical protein
MWQSPLLETCIRNNCKRNIYDIIEKIVRL